MSRLSQHCESRDNHFNLLRVVSALGVLWAHSYLVYTGSAINGGWFGVRLDHVFVCVFFAISGFLICRSIVRSLDLQSFLIARLVRLMPALGVLVAITVGIVGPLLTQSSFVHYATAATTWRYWLNLNLFDIHTQFELTGLFEQAPYARHVNASLWTLPIEAWLYGMTAVCFCLVVSVKAFLPNRSQTTLLFTGLGIAITVLVGLSVFSATRLAPRHDDSAVMLLFIVTFMSGALFYLARAWLSLRLHWLLILWAGLPWLQSTPLFSLYFACCMVYLVLWVAYLPVGAALLYNRVGDYSYGLYIYGFLVQQSTLRIQPDLSYPMFLGLSTLATFVCAIVSWHLIEKPAQTTFRHQRRKLIL